MLSQTLVFQKSALDNIDRAKSFPHLVVGRHTINPLWLRMLYIFGGNFGGVAVNDFLDCFWWLLVVVLNIYS